MTIHNLSHSATDSNLLRQALRSNGLFSGISGLILLLGASSIAQLTGLSMPAIRMGLGGVLVLYGAGLLWHTGRESIDRRLALAAVLLDLLWVAGSIILLLKGGTILTTAGRWTVALIAEAVGGFAALQLYGLWRIHKT